MCNRNIQKLNELKDILKKQLLKKKTETSQKFIEYDNLMVRIAWNSEVEKVSVTVAEMKSVKGGKKVFGTYNNFKKDMHFFVLSKIKSEIRGWVNL